VRYAGQIVYERIYSLRHMHMAFRHLRVGALATGKGLRVPRPVARRLTFGRGGIRLRLLEEALEGSPVSRWSAGLGEALGRDLAVLHEATGAPSPRGRWIGRLMRRVGLTPLGRLDRMTRRLRQEELSLEEIRVLDLVAERARTPDFLGDQVLCHGDLHRGNLLDMGDGRLGWIDLDTAYFGSPGFDLAAAQTGLLWRHGDALEAFEEAYVGGRPDVARWWHRHRMGWYALSSVVKCLTLRSSQGTDETHRSRAHFLRAQAAVRLKDAGGPSSTLVGMLITEAAVAARKGG
jgi:aminoglycoside phosphotransferase (APT) family kinase protein